MKDMKVLTKDAKLEEKIGRNHRTNHSSPTRPTNALTAGDHGTRDCPNRQPQTPSVSNPANGPGIYKNSSQSRNNSPQQH